MRVLVTGGGTGGHVLPALAVTAELKRHGAQVLFVGATPGDRKLVRAAGVPFRKIAAGKLRRYWSLQNFSDVFKSFAGYFQSRRIIKSFRPDVVFAKGGYVALPVARAARRLGVPVVLHESDASPGLSNRIAGKWATTVAVSFPPQRMDWHPPGRLVQTGNPIRPEITKGSASRARRQFGLSAKLPTVLVLGGSLGARTVNRLVSEALPTLLLEAQVIHQTGAGQATVPRHAQILPKELQSRYHPKPYLDVGLLADAYAAADLIVSRAGGGVAEIAAVGKPAILIPLPRSASRGEQIENAKLFSEAKAALVLPQDDLGASLFSRGILKLLHDPTRRSRMGRAARRLAHPDAAAKVAALVLAAGERTSKRAKRG